MLLAPNIAKLEARRNVKGLVRVLRSHRDGASDEHGKLLSAAAAALGRLGDLALPALAIALESQNPQERYYAAIALGTVGTSAIPILGAALARHRWEAACGLERIGETAIPALTVGLIDEVTRHHTAAALTRLHWVPSRDAKGAAYWVWCHKWDKCVEVGVPAIPILANQLVGDSRRDAAAALVRIGEPAIPALTKALTHPDETGRAVAAEALGHLRDVSVVEQLMLLLHDPSWSVRYVAADSLEKLGRPNAVADAGLSAEWQLRRTEEIQEAELRGRQQAWDYEWGSYYVTDAMMASGAWETPPPRPE